MGGERTGVAFQRILRTLGRPLGHATRARIKQLLEPVSGWDRGTFYSQFGEDAYLQAYFLGKDWKAGAKPMLQPGFYVDVGAYAPIQASNTYWFYRRGWRGVNIDATPGCMAAFVKTRSRDVNIEVAIAESPGELTLYHWDSPSVFNTASREMALRHETALGRPPQVMTVPARRLVDILDAHVSELRPISFLSVDVEGGDLQVLKSSDWKRYRPELVLVEDHGVVDPLSLASSPVSLFLQGVGYAPWAWLRPTVIFKREWS